MLCLSLLLTPCSLLPAGDSPSPPAPAVNWSLPIFSDKEGFRVMTARGSEARPGANDGIVVTDLNITVFSGDADAKVQTIMLSPAATFYPKQRQAGGDRSVRVLRDDLEATGQRWTYDQAKKLVTLDGDVRIIFNAPIGDLLK
jgi:hypothetical protein